MGIKYEGEELMKGVYKMKKHVFVLTSVAALASLAMIGCSNSTSSVTYTDGNMTAAETADTLSLQVASGLNLGSLFLGNGSLTPKNAIKFANDTSTTDPVSAATSSSTETADDEDATTLLTTDEIATVTSVIPQADMMLINETTGFTLTATTSDKTDYAYRETLAFTGLDGKAVSYDLYYNEVAMEDWDEDDVYDTHHETETTADDVEGDKKGPGHGGHGDHGGQPGDQGGTRPGEGAKPGEGTQPGGTGTSTTEPGTSTGTSDTGTVDTGASKKPAIHFADSTSATDPTSSDTSTDPATSTSGETESDTEEDHKHHHPDLSKVMMKGVTTVEDVTYYFEGERMTMTNDNHAWEGIGFRLTTVENDYSNSIFIFHKNKTSTKNGETTTSEQFVYRVITDSKVTLDFEIKKPSNGHDKITYVLDEKELTFLTRDVYLNTEGHYVVVYVNDARDASLVYVRTTNTDNTFTYSLVTL